MNVGVKLDNIIIMINFHPLEVGARGSETQPQVGENENNIAWREKV